MDLRCIIIVHPINEVKDYRKWAAFFRLIGVFVCEKLEEKWDRSANNEETIAVFDANCDIIEAFGNYFDVSVRKLLGLLYKIYEHYNLMRASYAIEYFSDAGEMEIYKDMEDAHGRFYSAFNDLYALESEDDIKGVQPKFLIYLWAAQANCMRRMNQLYTIVWDAIEDGIYGEKLSQLKNILWQKHYYSHEEILKKIRQILSVNPDYYGAYTILGFAELLDDETKVDAMDHFLAAVQRIDGRPYSSYLRYRMGRYYETVLVYPKKSLANYEEAYRVDPDDYRALFKLAVTAQARENFSAALASLDELIKILLCKKDSKALQPIECAYLYKAYKNKGAIYLKQRKYAVCIEEMKHCVEIYESKYNEDPQDGFYPFMFGDKAEVYKRAARRKLEIWKVYENMAEAAASIDRYEDYKAYRALAENSR